MRVEDGRGRLAGSGTINPGGLIAARLHARGALCAPDEIIIRDSLRVSRQNPQAWLGSGAAACRVAFGEADDLPGLVVDRYGDYLDAQMLTASMERRTPWILAALDGL